MHKSRIGGPRRATASRRGISSAYQALIFPTTDDAPCNAAFRRTFIQGLSKRQGKRPVTHSGHRLGQNPASFATHYQRLGDMTLERACITVRRRLPMPMLWALNPTRQSPTACRAAPGGSMIVQAPLAGQGPALTLQSLPRPIRTSLHNGVRAQRLAPPPSTPPFGDPNR